jgi:dipeptidase
MNEYGVVIASDQCRSRENDPELTDGGIGYWLRRAVAERARTAKQAVRIAGQFIEKFGYASSGRTYVIADPKEGWMLSAVYGKHWIAQRVPDDKVAVIPNFYTIGSVDLADTLNFLGSSDIIDYAVKNNWYDPDNQKPFHFSKVYSDPETLLHPNNIKRMWRGVNLLSKKEYKLADDFPFAFTPNKNVSVQDLTSILRDHYLNTEFDHTHNLTAGNPHLKNEHTICASHNQYGFVAQLRNGLPKKMGCVLWIALRRPCSQPFIPWYLGLEQIPNGYNTRNYKQALIQHFNPPEWLYQPQDFFSFWSFIIYTKQLDQNYSQMLDTAKSYYKDTERFLFKNQYAFEKKVLAVYKDNPQKADKMLTDYTCKWANKVWERIKSAD